MNWLGVLLLIPLLGQAQPQIFGYFESETDMLQVGDKQFTFGYNKARIDLEARPNDRVQIGLNMNLQTYWGQTTWNVFDFIPGMSTSGMIYTYVLPDTFLLDNAYMRLNLPLADITLGRQQISTGVGYAWNPTDIFNLKTLLDPSYEQTGVNAFRVESFLPGRTRFTVVIAPSQSWKHAAKQIWLKSGLGPFDLELTAAQHPWRSAPSLDPSGFTAISRDLFGTNIVGELAGIGLWVEAAYNQLTHDGTMLLVQDPDEYYETLLGLDYTFDNSLYVMSEFLHNGYGISNQNELTVFDYMASLGGEVHSLMQDYAFIYMTHPTFDYVTLSLLTIIGMNDESATLAPQLDWNVFEDTNLSAQISYGWGAQDSEFGSQDWGLRLRVRSEF